MAKSVFQRLGPFRLTVVCAASLAAFVAISSGIFLINLRHRVLAESERNLANTTLIVARQFEHIFKTLENVQNDIVEDIGMLAATDKESVAGKLSHYNMHLKLADKAAGMPYIGSLVLLNESGRLINFSRQWPVPDINASDRDFFKAFQSDPNLTSFIGEPIRNRATGSWVIQVARKIAGPNGELLGLTSAALELEYLQKIFHELAFEPGSSLGLFRKDGKLLVQVPKTEAAPDGQVPGNPAVALLATVDHAVGITAGASDEQSRMIAARRIGNYPIVIASTKTMAAALADWRLTEKYLIFIAGLTIAAIAGFAILFLRLFKNYRALLKARTERETAQKLQTQGLQFEVALNNLSQGVVMFDASAKIVICNRQYVQMYGLSLDVVKPGITLFDLIRHRQATGSFKDDPDEYCARILARVTKGDRTNEIVETGSGRVVHVVDQPKADGGWVTTHEDITEQRNVERARDYNRKFLDLVIDNVPSTIVVKNARDLRYVLLNRAAEEYYGIPRENMLGKTAHEVMSRETAEYVTHLDKKSLERPQQSLIDEHTLEMPGGEKHVAMARRLCVPGEDGEPQYILAVVDDITKERATQDMLNEQKQQLDAAIRNMSQGLVMFDSCERVILFNHRYVELSGLPADFMRPGRTLREILELRTSQESFSGDIDVYRGELLQDIAQGRTNIRINESDDGRMCRVINTPMADGGWVATHEDVTEKVRAEKANELQNRKLDAALGHMSQGLCMYDASERLIVCNKRYAELYGLSDAETAPGTTLRAILEHRMRRGTAPVGYDNIDERIKNVTGKKSFQEVTKLGDGRYVSVSQRPLTDGGWVATHEDVTEARRREESFRLMFDENPVPMLVHNVDNLRIIAVNDMAVEHYGYSSEEFLAKTVLDIRPAEDRVKFLEHLKTAWQSENSQRKSRHVKADGTIIDVVVCGRSLNYDGCNARLVAVHDITKAQVAEDELRRTKKFVDTIIEHVPLPIAVKNVAGLGVESRDARFTLFNRAYEDLMGDSRENLVGRTAHQIYSKQRADLIVQSDDEALRSDEAVLTIEHPIQTTRHGTRLVVAKKTVVRDDHGAPQYLLTVIDDVTARRQADTRIKYLAHNDSLTGLPNRATFVEYLAKTLDDATKNSEPFAVLCIDLDRFKEANDIYGHLVGDGLLREAASRLRAAAGEESGEVFLARVGGDEFTVVVKNGAQPAAAEVLSRRLLAVFNDDFEVEGHKLKLGLSIGGAIFPNDGVDAKTLLANADAALYQAKAEARGSARFFAAELGAKLRKRRDLLKDMEGAIAQEEFILHYQPQVALKSGKVFGFESLVRWQSPKRGLVPPGDFISIAEESGLILPLGEWVLRESCREAASWRNPLTIAVNISPVQFHHGDLPGLVHSILLETGLAPGRLELEITEGVLIDDFSRAVATLCKLKSLGVKIALDDFGSGYSSLSYLHSFPFDKIKIDRSFIGDLEHNHHSIAIVRAIITLGHSLDVPVLGEGVETEAQRQFLVQEGCDDVQGYLTGRPYPIAHHAHLVAGDGGAGHDHVSTG